MKEIVITYGENQHHKVELEKAKEFFNGKMPEPFRIREWMVIYAKEGFWINNLTTYIPAHQIKSIEIK